MSPPKPCALCDATPTPLWTRWQYLWVVVCDDCYDGAPDNPHRNYVGHGVTQLLAVADWNEQTEDIRDATVTP